MMKLNGSRMDKRSKSVAGNQENAMKAFRLVLYSSMKYYMGIMWNIENLVIIKTGKE